MKNHSFRKAYGCLRFLKLILKVAFALSASKIEIDICTIGSCHLWMCLYNPHKCTDGKTCAEIRVEIEAHTQHRQNAFHFCCARREIFNFHTIRTHLITFSIMHGEPHSGTHATDRTPCILTHRTDAMGHRSTIVRSCHTHTPTFTPTFVHSSRSSNGSSSSHPAKLRALFGFVKSITALVNRAMFALRMFVHTKHALNQH